MPIAADGIQTWSVEQLCRERDIPEALDDLERRDIFDGRELRAMRRDEVRRANRVAIRASGLAYRRTTMLA